MVQGIQALSIRDYFNYYFAGIIWLLLAATVLVPNDLSWILTQFKATADAIGLVVLGVLLITVPYLVGFVLSPLGSQVTSCLLHQFGNPIDWVVIHVKAPSKDRHKGERLPERQLKAVAAKVRVTFHLAKEVAPSDLPKWFFPIRAYVSTNTPPGADMAARNNNLANLSESLLIPFPTLLIVTGWRLSVVWADWWSLPIIGAIVAWSLAWSYLYLREHWVKHVYRQFLAAK